MGNCLVTKLKESVNNDNLTELGFLKLRNTGLSDISINTRSTVSVTDGGKIYTSVADRTSDTNGVTQLTVNGNAYLFFKSGTYDILISNKYELTKLVISSGASMYLQHMEDIKYCTAMSQLTLKLSENPYFSNLSKMSNLLTLRFYDYDGFDGGGGDLADISTTITTLILPAHSTVSNPMHLTRCTNLAEVSFLNVTVSVRCSVEEFVSSCVTNNRTTGSIKMTAAQKNLFSTFYNIDNFDATGSYNTLEWDGTSKIIFKLAYTSATDIKKIYEVGATAQEIADWKGSNITVIDASTGEEQ